MDGFIERWKTDSKFKATVQLIAYGGFALFALLFGSISIWMADSTDNNTNSINNTINDNKFYFDDKKTTIDLPNNYQYIININLNDINYTYEGVKKDDEETIVKTINQEKHNYIKKGNTFYKNTDGINMIVLKEEVYDVIDYSYLNFKTINQYLSVSKKKDNQYLAYLKDIILGHESEKYIIITKDQNKLSIDYTELLQFLDPSIEKCNVEYIIEKVE